MKHKYASTLNRHQLLIVVDTSIPPYEPICLLVQLSQTTSPGSVLKEKMREIRNMTTLTHLSWVCPVLHINEVLREKKTQKT